MVMSSKEVKRTKIEFREIFMGMLTMIEASR